MAAVGLYLLSSCAYTIVRPDLLWNPIDREIKLASSYPVNLVPQNFVVGEQRAVAEKRLTDDGYTLANTINALNPPGGAPYYQNDDIRRALSDLSSAPKISTPGKTAVYWKDGPSIFPCGSTYDVYIGVSPDDLLQFVQATVSDVCL